MESQKSQNSQKILERKNRVRKHMCPDFRTYCKATEVKILWHSDKDAYILIELNWESRRQPYVYGQFIFEKDVKTIQLRRELFSTKGAETIGYQHAKKISLHLYFFLPENRINTKWVKYLYVSTKTIKLIEEIIDVNFHHFGLGNGSLDKIPKAQATKEKVDKLDLIKI